MSIISENKLWQDKYGLTQDNNKGDTSQNGVRFTGQYVRSLVRHNQLIPAEAVRIADVLKSCELNSDGLLYRDPSGGGGQEGPDNTYANLYCDHALGTGFAKRWLEYGRKNRATHFDAAGEKHWYGRPLYYLLRLFNWKGIKYVYNTQDPGGFNTSAWLGRQPTMVAQAKAVAGEELSWWDVIGTRVGFWLGANNASSQDGKVLSWFVAMTVKGKNEKIDKSIKYWVEKFQKQWPNGVGEVLAKYWQNNGHPDIDYLQGDFGDV